MGIELEPRFHKLLPTLMSLLPLHAMHKSIHQVISCYILHSKDPDTILSSLTKCLYNSNWKVRLSALNLIHSTFKDSMKTLTGLLGKPLRTALAYLSSDSSSLVSSTAERLLSDLKPLESAENQSLEFNIDAQYAANANKTVTAPVSLYIESSSNGLVFNILDSRILQEIEDESNWRARTIAMQQLENTLDELESFNRLSPYMSIFLRFITKLIADKNFKICEAALRISQKIAEAPGIETQCNLGLLMNPCIQRLGDTKISLRMASYKTIKTLLNNLRSTLTIPLLYRALESSNWHIREEVLNLLTTSMLLNIEYNYRELTEPFAKLMDDPRPKVRIVAVEAIVVLQIKVPELLEDMQTLLDSGAFELIQTRLKSKQIAKLTEDYVEYPRVSVNLSPIRCVHVPERDDILSARQVDVDTTATPKFQPRPLTELVKESQVAKSYNYLPRKTIAEPKPVEDTSLREGQSDRNPHEIAKSYNYLPRKKIVAEPNPVEESYLTEEQLMPIKKPHERLLEAINCGGGWEAQFKTINILRRLTKHHQEVFFSKVTLHNVMLDVVKWADSLRSSLSKNALILMKEMCERLGKAMDSEIPELMKLVLKKAVDTNLFIADEAKKTLEKILQCLSEQKVLPFVLFHAQNAKNSLIKAQIAYCFGKIFYKAKESLARFRDIEKVLQILADFTSDAALEVRENTKVALNEFFNAFKSDSDAEILLIRSLKDSSCRKILACHERKPRSVSPIKSSSELSLRFPKLQLRRHLPIASIKGKLLKGTSKTLNDDWKLRYQSISSLSSFSKTLSTNAVLQTEHIVDTIAKGLSDSHSKIQVHSLSTLKELIPRLAQQLNLFLPQLVAALCQVIGLANEGMRELASENLALLLDYCDFGTIFACLVELVKEVQPRGKALVLKAINQYSSKLRAQDCGSVVSVACEYIDSYDPYLRKEAESLLRCVYAERQEEIFKYVEDSKLDVVGKILELYS